MAWKAGEKVVGSRGRQEIREPHAVYIIMKEPLLGLCPDFICKMTLGNNQGSAVIR